VARLSPAPDQPSAVAGALGDNGWSQLEVESLGTRVGLAIRGGGPGLLIDARQLLDDLDRKWNPARPESLVAQIEAADGQAVPVDDDTYALVEASLVAAEATDGAVGSEGLTLNPMLTRVTAPDGAVLDVDDLARARAADTVAEALVEAGAEGAVVDVGGALRLAGSVAEGSAWVVTVPDPDDEDGHRPGRARLGIAEGACVTVERPTAALASVTVLATDAATAMVLAAAADPERLAASGLPGLIVHADGRAEPVGGVEAFLRD
jgi:thiamine biosynthesis lipoprotein